MLVGHSKATDALGLPGEPLKPQEYIIRYLPDTLVRLGCEAGAAKPISPRRGEGRFGRALEFDGRRDVMIIDKPGFRDEAGTLEAWVWLPAEKQPDCHGTILRLDGVSPWTYHILQRDMKTGRISYTTYDGKEGHGVASGDLAEGWHHVAGTFDAAAGKMELFIDGRSVGATKYVKTTCGGSELGIGGVSPWDATRSAIPSAAGSTKSASPMRSAISRWLPPGHTHPMTARRSCCTAMRPPGRRAMPRARSAVRPLPTRSTRTPRSTPSMTSWTLLRCAVVGPRRDRAGLPRPRPPYLARGQPRTSHDRSRKS